MGTQVHIVHATCGRYSDREEWLVAAYTTGNAATEHLRKAQDYDDEAQRKTRSYDDDAPRYQDYPRNPWDRRSPQYDAVTYTVAILTLNDGAAMPATLPEAVRDCAKAGEP